MEISQEPHSSLPSGSSERRITKEQLKVDVYTPTFILSGYVHCLPEQRLLDLLNSVVARRLRVDTDFSPVTEATIRTLNDKETTTQFVLINKANILFVIEIGQHGEHGIGASYKLSAALGKAIIVAKFHIPPYILTGQMHCAKGQRLSDLLNTEDKFLPMTDVEIASPSGTQQLADFVAVNKAQIIYAQEESP